MRRKKRSFERLESRALLAAYINEILFDPLFGNPDTDQYIELRGRANGEFATGTYLVVVESEKSINNEEGKIHGIFDLSGQSFGSNGFLVMLPQNSPFNVDASARVLRSTQPGFGGLPGDIYQDSHPLSDRIDFIYGSNTYFLIQTDVEPQLGDDIDTNSDGLIDADGIVSRWNIFDSISTMWGLSDGYGYGSIVFVDNGGHDPEVIAADGTTVVRLDGTGYVGRVGNSTGSGTEDWVAGVVKDLGGDNYFMRLAGDIHGRPAPIHLHGRELDSLGSENFTGAVRVSMFDDQDRDGQWDEGEAILPTGQLLADTNNNGRRDLLTKAVDPDDFDLGLELRNLTPGVTLSTAVEDNVVIGFDINAVQDFGKPVGDYIFAHAGVGFFNSSRRLRMDFYRPAQSVSAEFIGHSNLSLTYGRLEAYDAKGNLLQMRRIGPLGSDARQTITISRLQSDIAYAVAYSDENYLNSSPFGKIGRIEFSVPEAVSYVDSSGNTTLNYLDPGDYTVISYAGESINYDFATPVLKISRYENFEYLIPVIENLPPQLDEASFSVDERSPGGTIVGTVTAIDDPSQSIAYSLVSGGNLFRIDSMTGVISVRPGVILNHESNPIHVLRVRATDDAKVPLSTDVDVVVRVNDINEPPTLGDYVFQVSENLPAGTKIGVVKGFDPDNSFNGLLGYRIVGTNPFNAITIDGLSGEISVNNPVAFNYEARTEMVVTIEAFDAGTPAMSDIGNVTIRLQDTNEAPRISTTAIPVGERLPPGGIVGRVRAVDVDQNQTFTFTWGEGFFTDQFTIDAMTGDIRLATGHELSYANQPYHALEIQVTDSGVPPLSAVRTVVIEVGDENNPPQLGSASFLVDENAPEGTFLGTIGVGDPDLGQTHLFAVVGGTARGLLTIGATTGEVRVAPFAELDFETTPTLELVVQVWDSGDPIESSLRAYQVTVNNLSEPPVVQDDWFVVNENASSGTQVGIVSFSDSDEGDELSVSWGETDGLGLFDIDSRSGLITVADGAILDFESASIFELDVRVHDSSGNFDNARITVQLRDLNEAPIVVSNPEPFSTVAGFPFETYLPGDLFADPEGDQYFDWSLTTTTGELPGWLRFDPDTRQLSGHPWNPHAGQYDLMVHVHERGTPSMSASVSFELVIHRNDTPWHNHQNPMDVREDGRIDPLDALSIINYLTGSNAKIVHEDVRYRPAFFDVNGNNRVEPMDALLVINALNRAVPDSAGRREGKATSSVGEFIAMQSVSLVSDNEQPRGFRRTEIALDFDTWDRGLRRFLSEID